MKLKDYMVGDWILSEHQFPMKVVSVGTDYLYADFEGNEGDVFEFDEKCMPKPIPLTKEIIYANGFERGHRGEQVHKNKGLKIYYEVIGFKDAGWIGRGIDDGIIFVHELQHFLRLVGKEDLADNLKIV